MNAPTHTPAPWVTINQPNRPHSRRLDIVTTSGEFSPAFVAGDATPADAALISAAPDLLATLEALAVWTHGDPCFCHVHGEPEHPRHRKHDFYCCAARAAIRKAKGGAK